MIRTLLASTATAFLALSLFAALGQAPAQRRGVLSVLHAGQPVSLKEAGGRYEIGVFEGGPGPLGHKVVEIADAYLVVQDVVGVSETRIPVFSIKAVVTWTIGK